MRIFDIARINCVVCRFGANARGLWDALNRKTSSLRSAMTRHYSPLFAVAILAAVCSGTAVAQQRSIEDLLVQAEEGDAEAQNELGSLYYAGEDVGQDDTEAVRWTRRAADQGYAPAQYNLGLLYFRSRGVLGDDVEAAMWYRRAAEQGYAPAQGGLGYMLAYGAGVDEDYVLAYMWLELAGNGATSNFTRRLYAQQLDELAQRMTPDQIVDAKRLARDWEVHPR